MGVFQTPQETYAHLRATHGGIYEAAPAGVVAEGDWDPVFLAGQAQELARIERERVARVQALRRPNAVAANPFVGQNQIVGPQAEEHATRARVNRQIFADEEARQLREAARRREENRGGCIVM